MQMIVLWTRAAAGATNCDERALIVVEIKYLLLAANISRILRSLYTYIGMYIYLYIVHIYEAVVSVVAGRTNR